MSAPTSAPAEEKPGVQQAEVRRRRRRSTPGRVVVAVLRYLALVIVGRTLPAAVLSDSCAMRSPWTPRSPRPAGRCSPKTIHWENLPELFTDPAVNILQGLLNSAIIAVLQTAGMLLLCSMAGYGLARIPYRWATPIFYAILVTLMIPAGGDVHPVVHHRLPAALGGHLPRDHRAGALQRLHNVPVPPVLPQLPAQPRGGGTGRRAGVLRRVLAGGGAQLRRLLRGDRGDHFHR